MTRAIGFLAAVTTAALFTVAVWAFAVFALASEVGR